MESEADKAKELLDLRVCWSFQRALLGNVAPNLRAVVAEWGGDTLKGIFYFDGPISSDDFDDATFTMGYVVGDLWPHDFAQCYEERLRLDFPAPFPDSPAGRRSEYVYMRKE